MHKYRSLVAWQRAHEAMLLALRTSDAAFHPRSKALFDQLRRAVISVEANIVEGYALSTPLQFRRHLRIAMGSAAEAESLTRAAGELGDRKSTRLNSSHLVISYAVFCLKKKKKDVKVKSSSESRCSSYPTHE